MYKICKPSWLKRFLIHLRILTNIFGLCGLLEGARDSWNRRICLRRLLLRVNHTEHCGHCCEFTTVLLNSLDTEGLLWNFRRWRVRLFLRANLTGHSGHCCKWKDVKKAAATGISSRTLLQSRRRPGVLFLGATTVRQGRKKCGNLMAADKFYRIQHFRGQGPLQIWSSGFLN